MISLHLDKIKFLFSKSAPLTISTMLTGALSAFDVSLGKYLGMQTLGAIALGNSIFLIALAFLAGITPSITKGLTVAKQAKGEAQSSTIFLGTSLTGTMLLSAGVATLVALLGLFFNTSLISNYSTAESLKVFLLWKSLEIIFFGFSTWVLSIALYHQRQDSLLVAQVLSVAMYVVLTLLVMKNLSVTFLQEYGLHVLGTLTLFVAALRFSFQIFISKKNLKIDFQSLFGEQKKVVWNKVISFIKVCLPANAQPVFLLTGFSIMVTLAAHIGAQEAALTGVLMALVRTVILPMKFIGTMSGIRASQSPTESRQWTQAGIQTCYLLLVPFVLSLLVAPSLIIPWITPSVELQKLAVIPSRILCFLMLIEPWAAQLSTNLLHRGKARSVLKITFLTQWVIAIPLAYFLGIAFEFGIMGVWLAHACFRISFALSHAFVWSRGERQHGQFIS
jgi:Na+-driven multidrug efflux pump